MNTNIQKIDIRKIRLDGETQSRVSINEAVVAEYAEAISEGQDKKFPPVEVYHDGSDYWLADGFHRVLAFGKAGKSTIAAIVHKGTRSEAQWAGLAANKLHGLRRTNPDKKKAVELALKTHPELSNPALAEHVGVSHTMVANYRVQSEKFSDSDNSDIDICTSNKTTSSNIPEKRTCIDGRKYPARQVTKPEPKAKPVIYFKDSPKGKEEPIPMEPPASAELVDQEGNTLPDKPSIRTAFQRRNEITEMMTIVSQLKSKVLKAAEDGDMLFVSLSSSQFQANCGNLRRALRAIRPHAVCPYCKGEGCDACHGQGWVGEFVYDHAPKEMKGEAK